MHLVDRPGVGIEVVMQPQHLGHRQHAVGARLLEHDADPLSELAVGVGRIHAQHLDPPLVGGAVPLEDLDGGGLARAVGSQDGDALPPADLKGDVAYRLGRAVALGETFDSDGGRHLDQWAGSAATARAMSGSM